MTSFAKRPESPFAADGGLDAAPVRNDDDPYRALDELMAVVEMLCPVWPQRDLFRSGPKMLL